MYNFSAGPAVLPEEVLKEVADEMMDYNGTGMSVMEMSHRSAAFQEIIDLSLIHICRRDAGEGDAVWSAASSGAGSRAPGFC